MKVLFVSSGNCSGGANPLAKIQGESLKQNGIQVEYFGIIGKGINGYLKNIPRLKKFLRNNHYDIFHAHFYLSGLVTWIAGAKPLVVSLMGSEVNLDLSFRIVFIIFRKFFRGRIIAKSESLKKYSKMKKVEIIPNGVDLGKFKVIDRELARERLGFVPGKKYIIWVSDPERFEKNFKLAEASYGLLEDGDRNLELKVVKSVDHDLIPYYMNAADVLLLTSLWEGSPNVIKEAMACNCPIVATDVGDVKEVFGNTEGCYITSFNPKDASENLRRALAFGKRTDGREHIRHLDSDVIARRIIDLYEEVLRV